MYCCNPITKIQTIRLLQSDPLASLFPLLRVPSESTRAQTGERIYIYLQNVREGESKGRGERGEGREGGREGGRETHRVSRGGLVAWRSSTYISPHMHTYTSRRMLLLPRRLPRLHSEGSAPRSLSLSLYLSLTNTRYGERRSTVFPLMRGPTCTPLAAVFLICLRKPVGAAAGRGLHRRRPAAAECSPPAMSGYGWWGQRRYLFQD